MHIRDSVGNDDELGNIYGSSLTLRDVAKKANARNLRLWSYKLPVKLNGTQFFPKIKQSRTNNGNRPDLEG
ncbi:hypothetical protein AAFF_G00384630 [Aldrovandia affinis]|uniref:Uncharacterized protein n=1 Tax=Aldrovandia affinis TaxID=143900 RepID=A0AAD7VYA7_9TELE|nr:hypothetical protein AAFF_G00384630 [Aldrovandia affinis]